MGSHTSIRSSQADRWQTLWLSRLAAVLIVSMSCVAPQAASAATGYSVTPSTTEPYAACAPPTHTSAQCEAIIDPSSIIPPPAAVHAANAQGITPALSGSPMCFEGTFTGENEFCGSGANHGFSPQDLESAYRLPSTTGGSGQTVAIVDAYDDPTAQADLNVYRATYDLPPCATSCFTKVNQEGKTTYPEANGGWDGEISLDLDMVSAACPKCHILLVEANNNTLENLGIAENEAAKWENVATKEKATEISNSYGAREIEVGKALAKELGEKYYTHPSIPITAAGGDRGYDNEGEDETNEKKECLNCSPNFPAGLTNVVAVGGTSLAPSGESGRGWGESVWGDSGSGCTLYATKPSWQTAFAKGCTNRIDNDISAEASAATPVSVYDTSGEFGWTDFGGTSVATPLAAGVIALESSTLRSEGLEGIYKHTANWYDITTGRNWLAVECKEKPLCTGEVGYDGPTGVGTPDGGATATPPSAYTEAPTGVTTTTATLNAVVDAEASEATYYFQYGRTMLYGSQVPATPVKVTGYTAPASVAQSISGLTTQAEYHFRIVVTSAGGITYGTDHVFWTAPKQYRKKVGSKGKGEGQFEAPQFTATNSEGDVWISDYTNDRIEEFSPTGVFIRACGEKGSGEKQFNGPTYLTVNGGGIYVTDSGNDRIEELYQSNAFACGYINSYGTSELSSPAGVAVAGQGRVLLVANTGANDIAELDAYEGNAKVEASFGTKGSGENQFASPTDIIFGGMEGVTNSNPGRYKEGFYVVDSGNNRVQKYTLKVESYAGKKPEIAWKYDSAFGTSGVGEGQFSSPTAIALDPTTGDLDVTDTGNKRVEEFLPSGTYVAKFGSAGTGAEAFERPYGVSISGEGTVYVADPTNNSVSVWSYSEWRDEPVPDGKASENEEDEHEEPYSSLDRVSCVAWSYCEAVGSYSPESNKGPEAPLAEVRKNGDEWSRQSVPLPTGTVGELDDVSCVSSGACMTVGGYGKQTALAESWNGSEWAVRAAAVPAGAKESYLEGVSCSSASACTAVGTYKSSGDVLTAMAERWNGSTWTVQTTAKLPAETLSSHLNGVSCPSASVCIAVGQMVVKEAGVEVHHVLVERWNGTEWTSSLSAPEGDLYSVSCTSESTCMAVGAAAGKASGALGEHWNGSEWTAQSMVQPEGGTGTLYSVSCGSSTMCTAVGRVSASTSASFAEQWSGTGWALQSTEKPEASEHVGLFGISCTATPKCLTVGYAYAYRGLGYNPVTMAEVNTTEELPSQKLPVLVTEGASGVEPTKATLHGTVNPERASTKYHFEYGTSTGYGSSTSETSAGEGSTPVAEMASVSGLTSGTTYHYRIVASNSVGTSYGADMSFTPGAPAFAPAKGTSAFPVAFTTAGAATSWHSEDETVKCTGETGAGKVTSVKEGKVTLKYTGCTWLGLKCGNTKEGEIETKELKSLLAYTYPAKSGAEGREAGLVLSPASGEVFSEFNCDGTEIKFVLKGSVMAVVTPLKARTASFTLAIKQTSYVQQPSEYESESGAKVATGLTCAVNGGKADTCGEEETTPKITLTSEEGTIEE